MRDRPAARDRRSHGPRGVRCRRGSADTSDVSATGHGHLEHRHVRRVQQTLRAPPRRHAAGHRCPSCSRADRPPGTGAGIRPSRVASRGRAPVPPATAAGIEALGVDADREVLHPDGAMPRPVRDIDAVATRLEPQESAGCAEEVLRSVVGLGSRRGRRPAVPRGVDGARAVGRTARPAGRMCRKKPMRRSGRARRAAWPGRVATGSRGPRPCRPREPAPRQRRRRRGSPRGTPRTPGGDRPAWRRHRGTGATARRWRSPRRRASTCSAVRSTPTIPRPSVLVGQVQRVSSSAGFRAAHPIQVARRPRKWQAPER